MRQTIFWARFPPHAKRAATSASSPQATATACSLWARTPGWLLAGTSLGKSVTIEMDGGRRAGKIRRHAARAHRREKPGWATPPTISPAWRAWGKDGPGADRPVQKPEGVYGHLTTRASARACAKKLVREEQAQLSRALAEICRSAPVPTQRGA